MTMTAVADNLCRRCGTCCRKGGPALHLADRPLVDNGQIPVGDLVTLRKGELARDNIKGGLLSLDGEIIKIKGRPGSWTCCYFEEATCGCGIYDNRPIECRLLNCRDTRLIEAVYANDRLTRRDLIADIPGLWELVAEHERRCNYAALTKLVDAGWHADRMVAEKAILEMLRYDALVRELAQSKGQLDGRMLDFVFGRRLADTIKMFAIRIDHQQGCYRLVPTE